MNAADLRCELRLGRWQDALGDVGEVDALITDPPYSERTHGAYREMAKLGRKAIEYAHLTEQDARALVSAWAPRTRGWMVIFTDHFLAPVFAAAMEAQDRYAFAPLACVEPGARVRLCGDGPSNWTCYAVVSRPRTNRYAKWGALPGAYVVPGNMGWRAAKREDGRSGVMGGKPLWLMRALVRDYSRPGDLICDPCAGAATTLIAARAEGRHSVGAEMDPATHALAAKRIGRPYTPMLFEGLR
jgi:site-specific DNA-methyltransferase (adenine-specific)